MYDYLFSEVSNNAQPTSYRKALQRYAVSRLLSIFNTSQQKPYYPVVLKQLKMLQTRFKAASGQPHFAALADLIERDLAIVHN